jgi:tetratricopeptide (TPR) repeat protein
MAAAACAQLGRLDEAEPYARAAVDRARSPGERAEALALLAGYAHRRGQLDEAERVAREADVLSRGKTRMPWMIIAQVERERDHLEAAIEALERARAISISHVPAKDRRVNAMVDQSLAVNHAQLGHRDRALELVGRAEAEIADDPRRSVQLDACAALVHALLGNRNQSLARIDAAERKRHAFTEDPAIQKVVLSHLGWAALAIDEPATAEAFLREFLDLQPDPVYLPYAWYHLGGCRRRLGDEVGGRECDTKATSTRFGVRWEDRARERLADEGLSV